MWRVVFTDEAAKERLSLPAAERNALLHAVEKLEAFGPRFRFPAFERGSGPLGVEGVAAQGRTQSVARVLSAQR